MHDDRELVAAGVDLVAVAQHRGPELVQHQDLLRQHILLGEVREPGDDRVDLLGADRADLTQVDLVRPQAPFRVQGQTDVGVDEQFLIELGLGQEVGAPRLQVQHDVDARRTRGLDPRPKVLDRGLGGVVTVAPGRGGGDRRDDLEGRHDRYVTDRLVLGRHLVRTLDGLLQWLLTEDAERRRAGVAVEGDHQPSRVDHLTAAGQLHAGGRDGDVVSELLSRAELLAEGHDRLRRLLGERRDGFAVRARVISFEQQHPGSRGAGGRDRGDVGCLEGGQQQYVRQRGRGGHRRQPLALRRLRRRRL